ncbi:type II toxin-antitoxin system RelE/ParE family toxin [Endozoicomonas sp. GU-1]|uniref:type II toxin-antitoxin system RelE/ParE family toxin n=1 Tax=Endozoicomonas sp. GU-1 TaxID=3009078 RepID=UPI0022B55B79|nr:type II toxin-antitoxin system RelE/ParE family toxin [Endozoicomonas sp. GU-1]WBA82903.1 type II toxin-antitoxin system RelE/ParE family toxin [Endozoicomonas sp. GU-1]WBA85830.1 type II toxin-antitoxin system RelE/ParE family toxin [Endozoicomonas sp. GU-1]
MAKVILTQDARQDILDIIAYTRDHFGKPQAVKLRQIFNTSLQSLREQPYKGAWVPELAQFGNTEYRQLVRKPFRIIYLITEAATENKQDITVAILLCADGRRNFSTLLQKRLFRH